MAESKHTPGPWKLHLYQSGTVAVVMREWVGPKSKDYGHGYLAAQVTAFNIDFHDERAIQNERIANARLIAAAPDLLFALQLILPLAKGYVALHDVGGNRGKLEAAEEAIAKAEGK